MRAMFFVEHFDHFDLDHSTLIGLYMCIPKSNEGFHTRGGEGGREGGRVGGREGGKEGGSLEHFNHLIWTTPPLLICICVFPNPLKGFTQWIIWENLVFCAVVAGSTLVARIIVSCG